MRSFGAVQRRRKGIAWILPYIPSGEGKKQYPLIYFEHVDRLIGLCVCRRACSLGFLIPPCPCFVLDALFLLLQSALYAMIGIALSFGRTIPFFSDRLFPAGRISNERSEWP